VKPGWEIINAIDYPGVDHVGNARDLSRFNDKTFSCVYASHVLEHFDYATELPSVLKEWYRVLSPGGQLYISVPDLSILAQLILKREQLNLEEQIGVMRMIYGGHTTEYDYHYTGFNVDILAGYLLGAGFTGLERVEQFDIFRDTSMMSFKGVAISLNVIAFRPQQD